MSKIEFPKLNVFSRREYGTLKAVVDCMVPEAAELFKVDLAVRIDAVLSGVRDQIKKEYKLLLLIVEYGPPLLGLKMKFFSKMSVKERDEYLGQWECSRMTIKRMGFQALKRSSLAAYYGSEEGWKGIHYRGPWLNTGFPHDYDGKGIQKRG